MSGPLFGVSSELKNMKFQKKINFLFSIYDSSFPNPAFRDVSGNLHEYWRRVCDSCTFKGFL